MTHANVIELAEQAVRDEPHCQVCVEPTLIVGRDSGLWLECASLGRGRALRADRASRGTRASRLLCRLVNADPDASAHTRRHLLDVDAFEPSGVR
jgi:hypothetical protein